MKLISAVIATALAADWPGQEVNDPCGTQKQFAESSVNATCTLDFNGKTPWRVYLGGEWITGANTFTNFDGMGADAIDVVVFWAQGNDGDGNLDNSTCGTVDDVTVSCVDQGAAVAGVFFQETANDYRMAKGSNYNIQVFTPPLFRMYELYNVFCRSSVHPPEIPWPWQSKIPMEMMSDFKIWPQIPETLPLMALMLSRTSGVTCTQILEWLQWQLQMQPRMLSTFLPPNNQDKTGSQTSGRRPSPTKEKNFCRLFSDTPCVCLVT